MNSRLRHLAPILAVVLAAVVLRAPRSAAAQEPAAAAPASSQPAPSASPPSTPPAPAAPPASAPASPAAGAPAPAAPPAPAPAAAPAPASLPLAPTPPPSAADLARAKESFKAGAAAYAAGEYLAAIQALEAAYSLTPLPAIAFSLAQAERRQYFVSRQREHLTRSIALFRRYIDEVPSGGRRTDALDALQQLEPIAAKLEPTETAPSQPAPERHTRLIIFSEAPGARIAVDGEFRSSSPAIVEVTPGKHQVKVEALGFSPVQREVTAIAGELVPVSVALAALPSRLLLSTPPDADVYIDGVFASQGGEQLALELPSGSHRVSVTQNGHRVVSRVIQVDRGETQVHGFSLEPTSQRRASHALFIGGAAAAAAGGALSYLAVRSQESAQEFLELVEQRNVSVAERVRYDADVTQRNRYRWLAGASFGASLGMLITGLFLHELDEPGPEDLYGPSPTGSPPAAGERRPASPGFDVSAVVSPDLWGATLRAEF